MMRVIKKKGVTLLELMIVIGIVAILSVILFRTFGSISQIAFHVEQQRNVSNELISLSQIIQNYADKYTIDYDAYKGEDIKNKSNEEFEKEEDKTNKSSLVQNNGLTDVLFLSGKDGNVKFYSSGACINMSEVATGLMDRKCRLEMDGNGEIIQLTNPNKIYLSKVMFKIIPFASENDYATGSMGENIILSLNKPGFWMLAQAYNAKYNSVLRTNRVSIHLQQFFNLK